MNRFSKLLGLGVLALGVSLSSCEKEETINPNNNPSNEQTFVLKDAKHGDPIPGQYIVVLKENSSVAKKSASFSSYEASQDAMRSYAYSLLSSKKSSESTLEAVFSRSIQGFSAKMDDATIESLKSNPEVAYIEQDRVVVLQQPRMSNVSKKAETVPWGVARVNGGQTYTGGAELWVIDTGVDLDHPDLNVAGSRGFSAFANSWWSSDRTPDDRNGHGTHCAGISAARNNGSGIVGVAAGATIIPVKVLNRWGSGSNSGVIAGIDFVTANASSGDVANMSLGGGASTSIDNAVKALANSGVKVAVAAGNESQDANNVSPARVNHSRVYTVSSFAQGDNFSSFSNYGSPVDFSAPGSSIYSTYSGGGYRTLSGTSMASPHVAGLLLWGNVGTDGYVSGDPDGNPDPIASR